MKKKIGIAIFIIALISMGIIFSFNHNEKIITEKISYTELLRMISDDNVSSIEIQKNSDEILVFSKKDTTIEYMVKVPDMEVLIEYIQEKVIEGQDIVMSFEEVEESISVSNILSFILTLLPIVWIIILIKYMVKSLKNLDKNYKTSSFTNILGDDSNYIEKIVQSDVRFSDIAALDEEKEELQEIVDFLKNPEKYTKLGAKIPKGILLSGSPGTGKTMLAKAIAGEAGVTYFAISGSEFIEKYVGVGASRIRSLFKDAKKNAPCIIFIDEIDAIGTKRNDEGNSEHNRTLEQLLTELDGFGTSSNIILLAATNRPSSLDPALTRPGRFDRKIDINVPDIKGREEILKIHGKNKPFTEDVDFKNIAYNTAGFSGAELANILNESALIAARKNKTAISKEDIDETMKKVTVGLKKSHRIISEKERCLVANHEAGHAIVSLFLETQDNVKEVCIVPRGTAGGYTLHETVEDKNYKSKTELKEKLVVLLGGTIAEKIVLNDVSTGASNDLKVATKIARNMVTIFGMNDTIGRISFADSSKEEIKLFGDEVLSNIGNEISKMIKEAEEEAERLIKTHRNLLDVLVKELLEKETVSGERIQELLEEYNKTI